MYKVFVVIMVGFGLAACGINSTFNEVATLEPVPTEYANQINPLGAQAVAEGAKIFDVNCKTCHGTQGHGDGPASAALNPAPKNIAELQETVGDDYLFWRISSGKDGTAMIGWKGILSDEQIWQVISFIRSLE